MKYYGVVCVIEIDREKLCLGLALGIVLENLCG